MSARRRLPGLPKLAATEAGLRVTSFIALDGTVEVEVRDGWTEEVLVDHVFVSPAQAFGWLATLDTKPTPVGATK
jgi:hypothetical protein